jgi:hypothetical protein
VGFVGLLIGIALALRIMAPHEFDPTIFVAWSQRDTPRQQSYPHRILATAPSDEGFGHDGKYFFVQANDPWLLHPTEHAAVLDKPLYRAQRMLYPVLLSGLGFLSPRVVLWSMVVTNILALGLGTLFAAKLAVLMKLSPWLGLCVPLNPGLMFELQFSGSGILAFACCLAALYALQIGRSGVAVALFTAACLSRETMILFCAGIVLLSWRSRKSVPWQVLIVPGIAMAAWHGYLRMRLAGISGMGEKIDIFGYPFEGILRAWSVWLTDPRHLLINATFLAVLVAFVFLAYRSDVPLAWGALPLVAIAPFFSANIWLGLFNSSRALAPVFTAFPFLVMWRVEGVARPSALRHRPRGSSFDLRFRHRKAGNE